MATNRGKGAGYYNPFVTTGGTYENPRYGIVDYGAMGKAFKSRMAEIDVKKEKKQKDVSLEEIDLARGNIGDIMINPNANAILDVNRAVKSQQNILNDPNASAEDKRYAANSYLNIKNANNSVQSIINIANKQSTSGEKIHDLSASDLNKLFKENTDGKYTYDDFVKMWNNGELKIGVKRLDDPDGKSGNRQGLQVGGFYTSSGDFIDFETGINPISIQNAMNLQHRGRTNELINEYNKKEQPYGNDFRETLTKEIDTMKTKPGMNLVTATNKVIAGYDDTMRNMVRGEVSNYMQVEPGMMASVFRNLYTDGRWIDGNNENDAKWLKMYNFPEKGTEGTWNNEEVGNLYFWNNQQRKENNQPELLRTEYENIVKNEFDKWKNNKIKEYLENEFLLQTKGYQANPNTGRAEIQGDIVSTEEKLKPKTSDDDRDGSGYSGVFFDIFSKGMGDMEMPLVFGEKSAGKSLITGELGKDAYRKIFNVNAYNEQDVRKILKSTFGLSDKAINKKIDAYYDISPNNLLWTLEKDDFKPQPAIDGTLQGWANMMLSPKTSPLGEVARRDFRAKFEAFKNDPANEKFFRGDDIYRGNPDLIPPIPKSSGFTF